LVLSIALLGIAAARFVRTPALHPDQTARLDTVRLLSVLTAAMGLALARTQFLSTSRPFLVLSLTLVPCGLIAIWLMVRLIGAYRRERTRPTDPTLPDVETLQSRISSPFDGTKR
jgi:hypothetical protein